MLRNIFSGTVSSIYTAILSILVVPIYLSLVGDERYGLIGLYLILIPIISLLDFGFGIAVLRESARAKSQLIDRADYTHMMRGLEVLFLAVVVILTAITAACAPAFSRTWLNVPAALDHEVALATTLMFITLLLRWLTIIYRSKLVGFERIAWVSGYNMIMMTLRMGGVIPVLWVVDSDLVTFFGFQLAVGALECLGYYLRARREFPSADVAVSFSHMRQRTQSILAFAGLASAGGMIWVLAAQLDKAILIKTLSIADFGAYSLAIILANAVSLLSGPINTSLLPALSKNAVTERRDQLVDVLVRHAEICVLVIVPIVAVLSLFAAPVLAIWTGRTDIDPAWSSILALYSVANAMLALSVFAHMTMIALGQMRLYLAGIIGFSALCALLLIVGIAHFGAIGSAYAWLAANCVYLAGWSVFVFRHMGIHVPLWVIGRRLVVVVAVPAGIALCAAYFVPFPVGRWTGLAALAAIGAAAAAGGLLASPLAAQAFGALLRHRRSKSI